MNWPVSVIMTVYNGRVYIRDAVLSILSQTYSEFELLVVDDQSTDGTVAVVESIRDPRIKLVRLDLHVGRTKALNIAVHAAQGRYLAILDSDDFAFPNRLERQIGFLESRSDVALVAGNVDWFNDQGLVASITEDHSSDSEIVWKLLFGNIFAHSSVMVRRDALLDLGGYDESFDYGHDYHMYCSMAQRGFGLAYLRAKLSAIRISSGSLTETVGHLARHDNNRTQLSNLKYFLPNYSDRQIENITAVRNGKENSEEAMKDTIEALMSIYGALLLRQPLDDTAMKRVQADLARRIALLGWADTGGKSRISRLADFYIDQLVSGSGRREVYDGLSEACLSLAIDAGKQMDKRRFKTQIGQAMVFATFLSLSRYPMIM